MGGGKGGEVRGYERRWRLLRRNVVAERGLARGGIMGLGGAREG